MLGTIERLVIHGGRCRSLGTSHSSVWIDWGDGMIKERNRAVCDKVVGSKPTLRRTCATARSEPPASPRAVAVAVASARSVARSVDERRLAATTTATASAQRAREPEQSHQSTPGAPSNACPPNACNGTWTTPARLGPLYLHALRRIRSTAPRTSAAHGMPRCHAFHARRTPTHAPSASQMNGESARSLLAHSCPAHVASPHRDVTACVWGWWQPSFGALRAAVDLPLSH